MNIAIVKRGLVAALLLAGLSPIACGSDSPKSADKDKDTDSGSGGDQGAGGSPAHVDAGPPPPAGSVPCGSKNCVLPTGVTGTACCKSAFEGTCGMSSPLGGCVDLPPETPAGCNPLPSFPLFPLVPCCTAMGECGVDLTMVGSKCVNYADAKKFGDMNTPQFDGGTIGGMMVPMFNVTLPAEAMCTAK